MLCIATSCVIWLGLLVLGRGSEEMRARVLGGDGAFYWEDLRKEHVTQASTCFGLWGFALLRLTFSLIVFGVVAWGCLEGAWRVMLLMFSGMSFAGVGLYFWFAGLASLLEAMGCLGGQDDDASEGETLGFRAIWVSYQVMTAVAVFIFFIVYTVLLPAAAFAVGWEEMLDQARHMFQTNPVGFWTALCQHQLNIVFMLVEAYFNRMPFVRSHVLFAVAYGNFYVVASWFIFLAYNIFYYFFFDWRSFWTPLVYLILVVVLYYAFRGVLRVDARCKRRVDPELLPSAGCNERLAEVRNVNTELALPIEVTEPNNS